MMSEMLKENLKRLFGVKDIEQVPEDFRERCERVEQLIEKMNRHGSLISTQVLAVMAEQREWALGRYGDPFPKTRES